MSIPLAVSRSARPAGPGLRARPLSQAADPRQNRLLAVLPEAEWARWQPQLELVNMPLGKVLYESGGKLSHVYFPTIAIVSLLYVLCNRHHSLNR